MGRPAVSVVVPFRGDRRAAAAALRSLRRLDLRAGDELRIADNSDRAAIADPGPGIEAIRAGRERSSYHARNAAARGARGEWILFLDADCLPDPGLLDSYFAPPAGDRVGTLAGAILADPSQARVAARYARSRRLISQGPPGPGRGVAGGNLLVRRAAFESIGGFAEGIRSGGDVDLCWRLQRAGWRLEARAGARVIHPHRETLRGLLGQIARYGAGARWLDARHPGGSPRWPLTAGLAGSARDVAANVVHGRFEEASFRAIDAAGLLAHNLGYASSNRAGRSAPRRRLSAGGEVSAGSGRRGRPAPE